MDDEVSEYLQAQTVSEEQECTIEITGFDLDHKNSIEMRPNLFDD